MTQAATSLQRFVNLANLDSLCAMPIPNAKDKVAGQRVGCAAGSRSTADL